MTGHLEAKVFLLPFLHVLGSRTISGPYVRNALDAIQGVLRAGLFSKWQTTSVTESLRQIASTVIRFGFILNVHLFVRIPWIDLVTSANSPSCKFIHTDVAGDELVQVQLIETLRCLVGSSAAPLLNEQTQWQIIEFCCLTVAKTGLLSIIVRDKSVLVSSDAMRCTDRRQPQYNAVEPNCGARSVRRSGPSPVARCSD